MPETQLTNEYKEEMASDPGRNPGMENNVLPFALRQIAGIAGAQDTYSAQSSGKGRANDQQGMSDTEGASMAGPTREEIDAKLATVEARTETRFTELSGKIDRVIDAVGRANSDFVRVSGEIRTEIQTVKSDNKFTRTTIVVAIIASILAGLAALWVTQSNMLASFQAGIALHAASGAAPLQEPKSPAPTQTH
jgi:hypothetical protein